MIHIFHPKQLVQVNFIVNLNKEYFSSSDKGNSSLYGGEPVAWKI